MSGDRFFCAADSRARGESIYGTVARVRSWLLLEYPGVWRHNAIEDSVLLSPEVKEHIRSLEAMSVVERSLLIRREHRRSGPLRCFFVTSRENESNILRAELSQYDEFPSARDRATPVEGLLYAVCTHARHDRCCAKFGIAVSRALRESAGEQAWECSHVGGDRFAGNLVVFPYGIYYGRVTPDDVPEVVRRSESGQVWLPRYRGRSCFTRAVQIAEYFARAESKRFGIDEFRPIETVRVAEGITRVLLRARSDDSTHAISFRTVTHRMAGRLTCAASEESAVPQYDLLSYDVAVA